MRYLLRRAAVRILLRLNAIARLKSSLARQTNIKGRLVQPRAHIGSPLKKKKKTHTLLSMEIVGTVGAVVGLAGAIGSVSKELGRCIRTMRIADRDAYTTQMELTTFSHLLMNFDQVVSSRHAQGAQLANNSRLRSPVLKQGWRLIDTMEELLREVGFHDSKQLQSGWQRRITKFRWYLRKKEVLALCVQFNQVKMSIMAFVSSAGLSAVLAELKRLWDAIERLQQEYLQEHHPGFQEELTRLELEYERARDRA